MLLARPHACTQAPFFLDALTSYALYHHSVASPSDMLLSATANAFAAAALVLVTTLSNPPPPTTPIPVLEVIKVYGHLASTECFGAKAPPGSSCQLSLSYLTKELGLVEAETSISLNDFGQTVQQTKFQWPLKPFGIDKSLTKTATMNKGAETRVYMEELEKRGLYDKRNPTGPLPTSLRPKLNQELETEELDPVVVQQVYAALNGGDKGADLTIQRLQQAFQGQDALDYYSFLDLIGKGYIIWPQ